MIILEYLVFEITARIYAVTQTFHRGYNDHIPVQLTREITLSIFTYAE